MPRVTGSEYPKWIRPYAFHGLDPVVQGKNSLMECPFCGREGKLSVLCDTGEGRCLGCDYSGNTYGFIARLHKEAVDHTSEELLRELAIERRLIHWQTLEAWGVALSTITGEWLVPAYNPEGTLNNLYRWVNLSKPARGENRELEWHRVLISTSELSTGMFGRPLWREGLDTLYLCEGPWDAMALWEVLGNAKPIGKSDYTMTRNAASSLLASCNVLAVPGCTTLPEHWMKSEVLSGPSLRSMCVMYDNDHPRLNQRTGAISPPASVEGIKRLAGLIRIHKAGMGRGEQGDVSEGNTAGGGKAQYLQWDRKGRDHNPDLPSGYDVRDLLADSSVEVESNASSIFPSGNTLITQSIPGATDSVFPPETLERIIQARVESGLPLLLSMLEPVPVEWGREWLVAHGKDDRPVGPKSCTDWATLQRSWKDALYWTDGLDRTLAVMMAVAASVEAWGDQLWVKIIGPPSSGKTTLAEALSVCRRYTKPVSTMRGFFSGQRTKDGSDPSLAAQAKGKCLIVKDGDTILSSPYRDVILSEGRDLYDTASRANYRNQVQRNYEGLRFSWLLLGTESIRELDSSELGERMIDCRLMEGIDLEQERQSCYSAIRAMSRNKAVEANGVVRNHHDPKVLEAMQLTGGYLTYLRENMLRLTAAIEEPSGLDRVITDYAQFVAHLRCRPVTPTNTRGKRQSRVEDGGSREMAPRLCKQLYRLGMSLAVVLNRESVNNVVLEMVRAVALDTAHGRTLDIVRVLYVNRGGLDAGAVSHALGVVQSGSDTAGLLRFLQRLGVVWYANASVKVSQRFARVGIKQVWSLTPHFRELYGRVMVE